MKFMKKLSEPKKAGKPSIKGKQLLLGGLVVLVAVAGYYRFSSGNLTKTGEEEAVAVMSTAKPSSADYFSSARQERDASRSEAEELLNDIISDDEATADAKAAAREKVSKAAETIKTEGEIETLAKSKGYDECIAFIDEDEVRIVVKAKKLSEDKVSSITEIVTAKTDFLPSQIIISCHE